VSSAVLVKYRGAVSRLLVGAIVACVLPARSTAQGNGGNSSGDDHPLELSIGAVRTALEQSAVAFAINLTKNLNNIDFQRNSGGSGSHGRLIYFTPDIDVQVGDKDAFDGIVAKVTGNLMLFRIDTAGGLRTPNTSFFHAFPFSLGIETDRRFDKVNAIGEFGYVPWFQGAVSRPFRTLRVGLFIQGGYKAQVGDSTTQQSPAAGSTDQSGEALDAGLLRAKLSVRFGPTFRLNSEGSFAVGLKGASDTWYDIVNDRFYYHVQATIRLTLTKDKSFDFFYEKGSGAPNFNKGDQFGGNLTVAF
jgi:hypothetical protein